MAKVVSDYYAEGAFMYDHSAIARNQIAAVNIQVYALHNGWTEQMETEFEQLKQEATRLETDPVAVKEYREAQQAWLKKKNQ